ncbi:hypothetical protein [Coprothermobacter platensis]|uniref:hypothetical protein n=1 Tax=Coprothermobacter platensis TaxID=108819 RepID=UPI00036098C0|nr:hypothetical protein [Coprothermobacter platensis]
MKRHNGAMRSSIAFLLVFTALLTFGCTTKNSSSQRIGFTGSSYGNHMDYKFTTFTGTESNSFKAQKGDIVTPTYNITLTKGKITIQLISPTGKILWKRDFTKSEQGLIQFTLDETGWYKFLVSGNASGGSFDLSWTVE